MIGAGRKLAGIQTECCAVHGGFVEIKHHQYGLIFVLPQVGRRIVGTGLQRRQIALSQRGRVGMQMNQCAIQAQQRVLVGGLGGNIDLAIVVLQALPRLARAEAAGFLVRPLHRGA